VFAYLRFIDTFTCLLIYLLADMKCNACCRRGSRPVIGPCSMVTLFYYDTVTVTWFVSLSTQSNKIIKCNKLAYRRDSARRRSLRHSRSSSSSSSSSLKFLEWPKQQRHATTRTTIDRVSTSSIRQCCNSSGISVSSNGAGRLTGTEWK